MKMTKRVLSLVLSLSMMFSLASNVFAEAAVAGEGVVNNNAIVLEDETAEVPADEVVPAEETTVEATPAPSKQPAPEATTEPEPSAQPEATTEPEPSAQPKAPVMGGAASIALEVPGVETVALTMGERPANGTTTGQPFIGNTTAGSDCFRIPAIVTLNSGRIVAAADARWNSAMDGGGMDTIVSWSDDNGANWNYTMANYLGDNGNVFNKASSSFLDPALATDGETVYMLVDLFPAGYALNAASANAQVQSGDAFDANGRLLLKKTGESSYSYYLDGTQIKRISNNTVVSGYTVDDHFNITGNGVSTNLFFSDSLYKPVPTTYLYLTKSSNGGETWSAPQLLDVKKDDERFCGVGPGRGLVLDLGNGTQRILFPCYTNYASGWLGTTTEEYASFIYSDDGGKTWIRTKNLTDESGTNGGWTSEVTVTKADSRLYAFSRTSSNDYKNVTYFVSEDNGATWSAKKDDTRIDPCTNCQMSAVSCTYNSETYILLSCASGSARSNGKIYAAKVAQDGSLTWVEPAYAVNKNGAFYAYSSMTVLKNGNIGLLYESAADVITYKEVTMDEIMGLNVNANSFDIVADMSVTVNTHNHQVVEHVIVTAEKTYPVAIYMNGEPLPSGYTVAWTTEQNATVSAASGAITRVSGTGKVIATISKDGVVVAQKECSVETISQPSSTTGSLNPTRDIELYIQELENSVLYYRHNEGTLTKAEDHTVIYISTKGKWNFDFYAGPVNDEYTLVDLSGVKDRRNTKWSSTKKHDGSVAQGCTATETFSRDNRSNLRASINAKSVKLPEVTKHIASVTRGEQVMPYTSGMIVKPGDVITYNVDITADTQSGVNYSNATLTESLAGAKPVSTTVTFPGTNEIRYTVTENDVKNGSLTNTVTLGVDYSTTYKTGTVTKTAKSETVTVKSNAGDPGQGTVTYDFLNKTTQNGTLYYSINGGPLQELPVGDSVEGTFNTVITPAGKESAVICFFVKPNDGYALTGINVNGTAGNYYSLATFEKGMAGMPDSDPYITLTDEAVANMLADADAKGCDAIYWFTRNAGQNATFNLNQYCDKLPDVVKSITAVTHNGVKTPYVSGTVIELGDTIHYSIDVRYYKVTSPKEGEENNITFSNVTVTDPLTDFTKTEPNDIVIPSTQTADGDGIVQTVPYTTDLTVTAANKDSIMQNGQVVNTAELTYSYTSHYSQGVANASAQAAAMITLSQKQYVIDFGSPVTIDLSSVLGADITAATAHYGTVEFHGQAFTYTPSQTLKGIDSIDLTLANGVHYGVSIYPATSVFYEETFATYTASYKPESEKITVWTHHGTPVSSQTPAELGSDPNNYGYDPAYVNASASYLETSVVDSNGAMEFDFTGTGVTLYANTDTSTGKLVARIYKLNSDGTKKAVKMFSVDTAMKNGDTSVTGNQQVNDTSFPIISKQDLEYGNYQLLISYIKTTDDKGIKPIRIDGFRVYDTLPADSEVYAADGEKNPHYFNLRDALLKGYRVTNAEDADSIYVGTKADGTKYYMSQVYDEAAAGTNAITYVSAAADLDVKDLLENGPKNQIYLHKNEGITFTINGSFSEAQIGMKRIGDAEITVNGTPVNSGTDMFYTLKVQSDNTVTISNNGEGILAITDLKTIGGAATLTAPAAPAVASFARSIMLLSLELELPVAPVEPETADAALTVSVLDESNNELASTTLTAKGNVGESHVFTAADIQAAVEALTIEGYSLQAPKYYDVEVAYGAQGSFECYAAENVVEKADAVVTIELKNLFGKVVANTRLAYNGEVGESHTFTDAEVKAAVLQLAERGGYKASGLNSYKAVTVACGETKTVSYYYTIIGSWFN